MCRGDGIKEIKIINTFKEKMLDFDRDDLYIEHPGSLGDLA